MQRWLMVWMAALAACAPPSEPAQTIRIGAVIDRTGARATSSWSQAAHLAAMHVNEGLRQASPGRPLRFEIALSDSHSDPKVAVPRAQELVAAQAVKALITDSSEDDIALNMLAYDADPANDLRVPIVCMACTSPSINNPSATSADAVRQQALRNPARWNFRSLMSSTPQAAVILQIAAGRTSATQLRGDANGDGRFKLAVYAASDSFGVGYAAVLQAAAARLMLTPPAVVEQLFFDVKVDPDTYDWGADIARLTDSTNHTDPAAPIKDGVPDVIIEVAAPQISAALMRSYLAGGATVPLLHTHNFRTVSVLRQLGASLDGQEGTSPVLLDNGASGAVFAEALSALQMGVPPAFEDSNTYDAAIALMLATLIAVTTHDLADPTQVTGAQVRDAMRQTSDPAGEVIRSGPAELARAIRLIQGGRSINYEGASGPMDFDAEGNVLNRIAHWKVANVDFVDIGRYDCVAAADCPLSTP